MSMPVIGVAKFERFFRVVAGLDVDKADLKHLDEFINKKLYDLLIRGEAAAKANGRDIIQPQDLPITKGLQESINSFKDINEEIELQHILVELTRRPPLDLGYSTETEARFVDIVGGLGVALARSLKFMEPNLKNPMTEHWDRASRIFDLLL
jgi:hypothetical protein